MCVGGGGGGVQTPLSLRGGLTCYNKYRLGPVHKIGDCLETIPICIV